jgi:hypothetical protein
MQREHSRVQAQDSEGDDALLSLEMQCSILCLLMSL